MPTGTVKWFNEKMCYGFIVQDNGPDLFLHYSNINMNGFKSLKKGTRVEFEVEQSQKGPTAVNVTVV